MSARTDALVSQQETGKITAFIIRRCGRLPPGMSRYFNADRQNMFPGRDTKAPRPSDLPCRPAFAAGIVAPHLEGLFQNFSEKCRGTFALAPCSRNIDHFRGG
jgi:hypothetical protein